MTTNADNMLQRVHAIRASYFLNFPSAEDGSKIESAIRNALFEQAPIVDLYCRAKDNGKGLQIWSVQVLGPKEVQLKAYALLEGITL